VIQLFLWKGLGFVLGDRLWWFRGNNSTPSVSPPCPRGRLWRERLGTTFGAGLWFLW